MAQPIKALAAWPYDESYIPGTHILGGENGLAHVL